MAATLKTCPKCGKAFKGAGLNGHLRFTHRLDEAQVNALASSAKTVGVAPPRAIQSDNPVYKLMDELVEIQKRRSELKATTSDFLIGNSPAVDKALALLNAMEKEISDKLDGLKRQKGLPVGFFEELNASFGFGKKRTSS